MAEKMVKRVIEALLFVSQKPLKIEDLRQALGGTDEKEIKEAIEALRRDYREEKRSFGITELAGGYRIVTDPEFAPWIAKLFKRDDARLSNPAMETLAIIAYKQPLTRSEIERIRGVNVDGVIKTLLDKNMIRIRGRKDAPGRPITYGTTEEFLDRFGLGELEQLPKLYDFREHDLDFDKEKDSPHFRVGNARENEGYHRRKPVEERTEARQEKGAEDALGEKKA